MCARQVYSNLLIILLLLALSSTASYLFAATRGIQVVSNKGQPLYLYKDYHAVVIGVSDYDHWPKLPNAVKDSQQVAGIPTHHAHALDAMEDIRPRLQGTWRLRVHQGLWVWLLLR